MRLTAAQTDRGCGVLLGAACGDALGAGYEFGVAATGADLRTAEALDAIASGFARWYGEGPADVGGASGSGRGSASSPATC